MSDYLENALINHVLRNTALASPATVYAALFTTDPTDADAGTEVSGGAYARQAVTFDPPINGIAANDADVIYPTATANWGTVTHVGIYDDPTAGNLLFHGTLGSSKTVELDDTFLFKAGFLQVTLQ
jgi:hypothetical protein